MNINASLIFDSPKVLDMEHISKIFRHVFRLGNLQYYKQFHLSKAFSLPQAITGSLEGNNTESPEAPNSNEHNPDKFRTCCPIDIDMDDMDNDANDIDANVTKEEVPQRQRRGVYMSKGITIYIPNKNMPPGTCKYRLDVLPHTEPDDIRVIKFDKS